MASVVFDGVTLVPAGVLVRFAGAAKGGRAVGIAPRTRVDLTLRYKEGWTEAQRAAARKKAQALTNADTVVTPNPSRSGTSQSRYRRDNALDSNTDADHLVDLQLGGADEVSNLWGLDSSVNRSLGSQIQHQIKDIEPGTRVITVRIIDR